jgi:hypothetical protein
MPRLNCSTPENCTAPKRGGCKCTQMKHSPETIAKMTGVPVEMLAAYKEAKAWGATKSEAVSYAEKMKRAS